MMDTTMGDSTTSYDQELFVVQRCWHSGPQQYQPLDLLRLFATQRDAEEAAYHSAHAWCRYHNPQSEPQVKTLLLPRYPAGSQSSSSSYGFIAHGSLFWVRSLAATVLPTNVVVPQQAHVVLTEGVIGGTGNRNSRRGTEVPYGRVVLGHPDLARVKALEMCHHVMAQLGSSASCSVREVPLGKPANYTSGDFLQDWPPQVLKPDLLQNANLDSKRRALEEELRMEGAMEVQCPFEPPPAAKRRRVEYSSMEDSNTIMMSFGVAGEQA